MSQELIEAITDMREEDAFKITNQMLDAGTDPITILEDCREAMGIIGQRFESGECFIPELILAGEMLSQISTIIKPRLQQNGAAKKIVEIWLSISPARIS